MTADLNPDGTDAPLLGEPLAVEFANTRYAVRGDRRDAIATADGLRRWLVAVAQRLADQGADPPRWWAVHESDVDEFVRLRDAVREAAENTAAGRHVDETVRRLLNGAVRGDPGWYELADADAGLYAIRRNTSGDPLVRARAALARAAIDLLTGPLASALRACPAPGCVLLYVKNHPRREWCSAGCGNRVRAARHYARVRDAASTRAPGG